MEAKPDIATADPTLILRPASFVDRLDPAALFPVKQPLEVELGSGDGSFIAAWAKREATTNFIGVERLLGRLRKIDRKGRRLGLTNLRLLRLEGAYFLEFLIPPESLRALHIYFPDPWPKRKHRKNRLINERFTEIAARALQSEGTVYLRTDDADYYEQMLRVFAQAQNFQPVETPLEMQETLTDFERGFIARGVPTLRAAYQRIRSVPRGTLS